MLGWIEVRNGRIKAAFWCAEVQLLFVDRYSVWLMLVSMAALVGCIRWCFTILMLCCGCIFYCGAVAFIVLKGGMDGIMQLATNG